MAGSQSLFVCFATSRWGRAGRTVDCVAWIDLITPHEERVSSGRKTLRENARCKSMGIDQGRAESVVMVFRWPAFAIFSDTIEIGEHVVARRFHVL